MIEIDGGDGGGGVLRTALGLSIGTGRAVRIGDVRGDRPDPGLKPQHVACIEAACAVSDGDATGVEIGSDTVAFEPGPVDGGDVDVDVGTAGSATLVCSTVLPAALVADGVVRLRVSGGTDVAWSPPADYFGGVTLGALRASGLATSLEITRRGFYPAGGGTILLTAAPSTLEPIALHERFPPSRVRVAAAASDDLLDANVADRLARTAGDRLSNAGLAVASRSAEYVEARSTGAVVVIRVEVDRRSGTPVPIAGFSALGEPGVPAEDVANAAVDDLRAWRDGSGAVDRHLADQLVPILALVGGRIRIPTVTDHVESAVAVARRFGFDVAVEASESDGSTIVSADEPSTRLRR
ncbi:RNA 3'-terminal phosphate cyclase [Halorubrum sp. DTA98]|uniref:RNA 3'-terminal phosphate cyclase n=1 Tax=Halorubrum sp. DTA98 TaxID=3402163 RepID=UPI003AB0DAE0